MDAPLQNSRHVEVKASTKGKPKKRWGPRERGGPISKGSSSQPDEQPRKKCACPPKRKKRKPVKVKARQKQPKSAKFQVSTHQSTAAKPQYQEEQSWLVDIGKEKIANCRRIVWEGTVKLLLTVQEMTEAVQEILDSGDTHLGFDTETKPNFRKGGYNKTALIQLAAAQTVYLFRICGLPGHKFDPLLPILTNGNIRKSGVAIHNDVKELQLIQPFQAAGFVDTTTLTRDQLRIKNGGLRALAAHFLDGALSKKQQMSNWAAATLSAGQIRYAATDAWVSREIHVRAEQALLLSKRDAAVEGAAAVADVPEE